MDITIKTLFLILFFIKGLTTIQAVERISHEHDVTEQMNEWIRKIFEVDSNAFKNLLDTVMQKQLDSFVYTMKRNIQPIGSTLHLDRTYMNISEFESPQLNWTFSANKMDFFLKEFTVRIMADILKGRDGDIFTRFDTYLDLENVTFTLGIAELNTVQVELAYGSAWLWYDEDKSIEWMDDDELTSDTKQALETELKTGLVVLLRKTLNNSEDFVTSVKAIFNTYHEPKTKLIATHPDFFTDEGQKYYYFIPDIPYIFRYSFKDIFIKGIDNLESFSITNYTCTLNITNIRTKLKIDDEKPIEVSGEIGSLSLSVDRNKTKNLLIAGSFNMKYITYRRSYFWTSQSTLIVQTIKSAIANSIFPWITRITPIRRRTMTTDPPPPGYDITKYINECIFKLFESVVKTRVRPFIHKFENSKLMRFEYNLSNETNGFQDKKVFGNITSLNIYNAYLGYITYKFTENKIVMHCTPEVKIKGRIAAKNNAYFNFTGLIKSDGLIVVKLPKNYLNKTFYIDLTRVSRFEIEVKNNTELATETRSQVPRMVVDNMEQNKKLKRALNKIYGLWPKQYIVSKRREFLDDEQQFYYSIPEAPFFCFHLRDIKIGGIANFHSLDFKNNYYRGYVYSYTLLIKHIHGNVTLDYATEMEKPLELSFYASHLMVSLKFRAMPTRQLHVAIHGASVIRTKDRTALTNSQSCEIIRPIELAIGRSVMPNIDMVWESPELEDPIGQCPGELQSAGWEELKKSYKKWIPFNED